MRRESCLAALPHSGIPSRDDDGVNELVFNPFIPILRAMSWTDEQMKAMRGLGIDPALVPYPVERPEQPVEPVSRESDGDLTDAEFAALEPALPPEPRQAGALSNRSVLDALLWVQRTRKKLTQLPTRYGSPEAIRKRAERWAVSGDWDRLLDRLDTLSLTVAKREAIRRLSHFRSVQGIRIRQFRSSASQNPNSPPA